MNKINIGNAPAYTSPNSMTLICTEKPDGSTNLATLAFWAFASTNPGKIMFSLNKGAYSLELLAENWNCWLRRKKLFSLFPELN